MNHAEPDKSEKTVGISLLLDFYGQLLPPSQRDALELFYGDDLSLAEIAQNTGITRQGVRDRILRGEKTLRETEEKLGLVARFSQSQETLSFLIRRLNEIRRDSGTDVDDMIRAAQGLLL